MVIYYITLKSISKFRGVLQGCLGTDADAEAGIQRSRCSTESECGPERQLLYMLFTAGCSRVLPARLRWPPLDDDREASAL